MIKLLVFKIFLKWVLQQLFRNAGLELFYFLGLSLGALSFDVEPPSDSLPSIDSRIRHLMIRNIGNLENHQQILFDADLLFDLGCSVIIEDQFSTGMVLKVVREGVLSIVNNIVMAEQVIALEIVGGEDVVERVSQIGHFSKLSVEILLEELDGWLVVQLIGLEEVEEVAFLLEELEFAVGLLQLFVFFFREEVGD